MSGNYAVWSLVALIVRVAALLFFGVVAVIQVQQFKIKSPLQPLKWFLLVSVLFLAAANLPVLYVHWQRIVGVPLSDGFTAFASVSNSVAQLVGAVMLLLVYRFKGPRA